MCNAGETDGQRVTRYALTIWDQSKPQITGIDTNNDGVVDNPRSGVYIAHTVQVPCDEAIDFQFMTSKPFTQWSDGAPAWAGINDSEQVNALFSCDTQMGFHSYLYHGGNDSFTDSVTVRYEVIAAQP